MKKPQRIQRKRTRGFNLKRESKKLNGLECVYVGRPSIFGNPFDSAEDFEKMHNIITPNYGYCAIITVGDDEKPHQCASKLQIRQLRGKNLACWCALDKPCHADVLLKIANEDE